MSVSRSTGKRIRRHCRIVGLATKWDYFARGAEGDAGAED